MALLELKHEITEPVTLVHSLSLLLSSIPENWKVAHIMPISLKGCKKTKKPGQAYKPVNIRKLVQKSKAECLNIQCILGKKEKSCLKSPMEFWMKSISDSKCSS